MALEQLRVREIVKQAVDKSLDVPEFQREFVWDPEQVKLLAESLYRNYPVGSFLLWDSAEYTETKSAQGAQASLWIVDGQQRITALCLLFGRKPFWWPDAHDWNEALERYDVMVNLLPQEENERLEFGLSNPFRRKDPRWVSVRRVISTENVGSLTELATQIAKQIGTDKGVMDIFGKLHSRLLSLWQIRELDIPIVKISHEVEDVAEIFARLNQAGTRVKEADVVLALAAVHNPGWVRKEYIPFRDSLEAYGWDLEAGIFVRTMTGIGCGRARLIEVPKDFWNPENLPSVWKKSRDTIVEVLLKHLREFGIYSADLLPSTNSLIPLFALHHCWGARPGYDFARAFRWFLLANRDGRYSGPSITRLNEDVRSIAEATSFDKAIDTLTKRLSVSDVIEDIEFLNRYDRAGSRFLRLIVYLLLFDRKARDWVDGTFIGYDKAMALATAGFEPQWHHIYPRSVLKRVACQDDEIHAIANITVLNERTNANKLSDKEPWEYIREFGISTERRREHLVPEGFIENPTDDIRLKARYEAFLHERAQLLAKEANAFLQRMGADSQAT